VFLTQRRRDAEVERDGISPCRTCRTCRNGEEANHKSAQINTNLKVGFVKICVDLWLIAV